MFQSISYKSTNLSAEPVSFREALLKGLAPDKGLYMPDRIPVLTKEQIRSMSTMEYYEIAFMVAKQFLSDQIADNDLMTLVKDAYNFDIPLEKVYDQKYILRLDQGPTASFKDFAARMMGRLMQHYLEKENKKLLILTATSGDTGSAIASAFYGLDNIKVVILYPENEVTDRQRKQMTTLKKNIWTLALDAKFDDCQDMVKQAFADSDLEYLGLSSANSINIGRLLPQSMYYFYSFAKLRSGNSDDNVIFSVPSGNFGDLMGGLFAKKMGLPVKKFVVSTNDNDEVPKYLKSWIYEKIVPSKNCISSAMNVGHPSNMARLVALYGGVMDETGHISKRPDEKQISNDMYGVSISDEETKETIKLANAKYNLLLEPHGAVGWAGLSHYFNAHPNQNNADQLCICLETAHPAKFPKEINDILSIDPELPPSLKGIEEKEEKIEKMDNDYATFKQYLKDNF